MTNPLKILVVDNDHLTLDYMKLFLSDLGYEVVTAGDVSTALQSAASNKPDILLTDIGLPDASGIDLQVKMKSQFGTRGIALTGYGDADDIEEYRSAGFSGYLIKPIDLSELQKLIEDVASGPTDFEAGRAVK